MEPPLRRGSLPDWFLSPPQNDDVLVGVGVSPDHLPLSIARRVALTDAYSDAARSSSAKVSALLKTWSEERGVDGAPVRIRGVEETANVLASEVLENAKVARLSVDEDDRVFALVTVSLQALRARWLEETAQTLAEPDTERDDSDGFRSQAP